MNWIRGDCIGRGAYGTVNVALNKSNGNVFAVKSVDRINSSISQLEALENEIKILRKISSPYVVEYLGDDTSSESSSSLRNLHMEYLPGGTVADVAKFPLDEEIIRCYAWCIVSALSYLHSELGIIHGDIKGKNVLVGPTQGVAKLADFGSAMDSGGTGVPRGSPLWMAPEVVRGECQGPESDVWSVGCTVIEMVTGKPPWETRCSAADTLCMIGYSDEIPVVPERLSELGKDFIHKCLKREKSERWSCDQLLQHPFLLACSQSGDGQSLFPSPRGVLEWFSSEEEDDEIREGSKEKGENYDIVCKRYANCISELASGQRALWESDGWLVVREREEVEEFTTGEVASLEHSESPVDFYYRMSLEMSRLSEINHDDVSYHHHEGLDDCEYRDESNFSYGSEGVNKAEEKDRSDQMFDNCCKLLFFIFNFYQLLNLDVLICSESQIIYLCLVSLQFSLPFVHTIS